MSEKDRCPNGNPDCECDLAHELALTEKIMRMIGGYSQDEHIAPCPFCLRDTMLNVAALLHVEAARLYAERPKKPLADAKRVMKDFSRAASHRLEAIIETTAATNAQNKH
jgi:hypothetical protein